MDLTPFKLDIDELLDEFTKGNFTTLADMKRVWMVKKFSYIYEAKPTTNSAFFMQSLYAHCLGHMASDGGLSRRLGAIYCLYCLYGIQPYLPSFKIYLSLGELKKIKNLAVEAKENHLGVALALIKRMLDRNMFLFGFVDMLGGSVTQRVDELIRLQNKRTQIAYNKLFENTRIEDYLHMDLGADLQVETLKNMMMEYSKAKELTVKEASQAVDMEDVKHMLEDDKKAVDKVEELSEEWENQKEQFYKQTGTSRRNEIVAVDDEFYEIEQLLIE